MRTAAMQLLEGKEFKGFSIELSEMKQTVRTERRKQPIEIDESVPLETRIANQVTPLWSTPYPDQLTMKTEAALTQMSLFKKDLLKFMPRRFVPSQDPLSFTSINEIKEMKSEDRPAYQLDWIFRRAAEICPIAPCIPSPVIDGYRNKCEFTFGVTPSGERTLGFLLGLFKDGITTVLPPTNCIHVSDSAKSIARCLEVYAHSSQYDVYNRELKTGVWRSCLVRTYTTNSNMVIIQLNPSSINADIIREMELEIVANICALNVGVSSIYIQNWAGDFNGINSDTGECRLVYGESYVEEVLGGFTFRVSPFAFFQVNTKAAEVLYGHVGDLCRKSLEELKAEVLVTSKNTVEANQDHVSTEAVKDVCTFEVIEDKTLGEREQQQEKDESVSTVIDLKPSAEPDFIFPNMSTEPGIILLDLCCGTGTIGITLAKDVKHVIGVEMIPEAIRDAEANAKSNGIQNITFFASKVEDVIYRIFKSIPPTDKVIAILDPPRAGMHPKVILKLRSCARLQRNFFCFILDIIFVSCDLKLSRANYLGLCRPLSNKFKGHSFRPVSCSVIDMFPHTPNCEVVCQFTRDYEPQDEDDMDAKIGEVLNEE